MSDPLPSQNPYAAPMVDDVRGEAAVRADDVSAREVFWAWEKLRLYYNGILVLFVLVFSGRALFSDSYWVMLITGAFVANLGFCLGPVLEGYSALCGAPRRAARWTIFMIGTVFTVLLAAGAMMITSLNHDFLPGMD